MKTKLMSLIIAVCAIFSLSIPVNAADVTEKSAQATVSQFYYIVYDKDGNITETGLTPNFNNRATWEGITLNNGSGFTLLANNTQSFWITEGTRIHLNVNLDRNARMYNGYYSGDGTTGFDDSQLCQSWISASSDYNWNFTSDYPTGYYFFNLQNGSSDPVTITSVTLTF